MADTTGPISSLPGSKHKPPTGTMCDACRTAPAVIRIQGETDSMGSEMNDYCLACGVRAEQNTLSGECDWCRLSVGTLHPTRDMDEGSCGPVYYVCQACIQKQREDTLKEYNDMVQESRERGDFAYEEESDMERDRR